MTHQTQTPFRIRCNKDQIDKIPELCDLDWKPAYPEYEDKDPALLENRIRQNQIVLTFTEANRRDAEEYYYKFTNDYKITAFKNWVQFTNDYKITTSHRPRTEVNQFSDVEIKMLQAELQREELQVYTAIVMAKKDLDDGNYDTVIFRLKLDADKWRGYDTPINDFLKQFIFNGSCYVRLP